MGKTRDIQFMFRITREEAAVLDQIAIEKGFVGGSGVRPGQPNRSAAARFLLGKADRRLKR